jgi:hypothetical protein
MTARSLNEFISNIKRSSLARQNRFTVSISSPTSSNANLVELFCEQALLPSLSFASQPVRTYGEQREVVYDRNFESVQLTFLVDRQMQVKSYFDNWTDQIINPYSRVAGFYDSYVRDISIITQDTKDNDTYIAVLREAYPKTISAVQLDHNSKDVMKLQVTFNYKYHINNQLVSPDNDSSPKKLFGLDLPDPYKLSQQLGNYLKGSFTNAVNVPDLYYDNFQQFQESVNDRIAVTRALERQGQETGTGISSDLSDFYG